nr:MAG TPA: hypothetical protein [Caudoviricetes sp.]
MPKPVIPSLTIDGWDTNPLSQMSKLFEYYQASDYSQSDYFMGSIISLKYTLSKDIRPNILKENIEADLRKLYGKFFDTVEPIIDVQEEGDGIVNIIINLTTTYNAQTYTLAKSIKGRSSGIIEYQTKLTNKYKYDQEGL